MQHPPSKLSTAKALPWLTVPLDLVRETDVPAQALPKPPTCSVCAVATHSPSGDATDLRQTVGSVRQATSVRQNATKIKLRNSFCRPNVLVVVRRECFHIIQRSLAALSITTLAANAGLVRDKQTADSLRE